MKGGILKTAKESKSRREAQGALENNLEFVILTHTHT